MPENKALITDDVVVLGILATLLALIFTTASSQRPFWKKFYKYVPTLLLCYFIPGLLNSFGVISGDQSKLYGVVLDYLLPASLVLFTLSLDVKEVWRLRKKAGIMFITAAVGVIIGGPLALYLVSLFNPDVLGGEGAAATWRGMATVAGSWIGGGANQAALYAVFKPTPELFSATIAVDVLVANLWMAILLLGAGMAPRLDRFLKADTTALEGLKTKMENFRLSSQRIPSFTDTITIVGIGLGVTGLSRWLAGIIAPYIERTAPHLEKFSLTSSFLWTVVLASAFGIALSFTRARKLEGAGASQIGSVFLYLLIATIGMKMNVGAVFGQPALFLVGLTWISFHALLLIIVGKLTRTPFFFLAVNSQACVGGAASAPIVASAFHTSLAPVGVLLAICGYAVGTYGGYLCALMMQWVSGL